VRVDPKAKQMAIGLAELMYETLAQSPEVQVAIFRLRNESGCDVRIVLEATIELEEKNATKRTGAATGLPKIESPLGPEDVIVTPEDLKLMHQFGISPKKARRNDLENGE
jgi:hypothetical protein